MIFYDKSISLADKVILFYLNSKREMTDMHFVYTWADHNRGEINIMHTYSKRKLLDKKTFSNYSCQPLRDRLNLHINENF